MNNPVSFGAGVNSTALVILLVWQGWRGPILFADTGAERDETYSFLHVFNEWLGEYGLSITRIGADYRSNYYRPNLINAMEAYCQIPFMRARWCTKEYKIRPIKRWCNQNGYDFNQCFVGIAYDEAHRQPGKIRPLVDWKVTRSDCARVIQEAGLPVPPRSGCWCCPFQSRSQWRHLWETRRERYLYLAWVERRASFAAGRRVTFDPGGQSLFSLALQFQNDQPTLFDLSEFYAPCLCGTPALSRP